MSIGRLAGFWRLMGLAALCAGIWGCGGGGGGSGGGEPLPRPVVSGAAESFVVIGVGEVWEYTVMVKDSSGGAHEDYTIEWVHNIGSADGEVVLSSPAAGQERLSFTPVREGDFSVQARVVGRLVEGEDPADKSAETAPLTVAARGGPCSRIVANLAEVSLLVGEKRPLTFDTLANLHSSQSDAKLKYAASHQQVAVTVQDGDVAAWSDGVLEGLKLGSTKLTVVAGEVETSIPVTVVEGSLAAPGDGRVRMITRPALPVGSNTGSLPQWPRSLDSRMALDSKGYPHVVLQPFPGVPSLGEGTFGRLLVAHWTGSGFGTTALGPWWETIQEPRLAVDSGDKLWVAFLTGQYPGAWVADRAAEGVTGGWRVRPLPGGRDADNPAAVVPASVQSEGVDVKGAVAISSDGSKTYVAYSVFHALESQLTTGTQCVRKLRLAIVDNVGIDFQDIAEELYTVASTAPQACVAGLEEVRISKVTMLPPNFSSTLPRISALTGLNTNRKLYYFDWNGTTWNSVASVDPKVMEPEHIDRAVPLDFTIAGEGKTTALPGVWVSNRNVQKSEMWFWPMNLPREQRWTSFFPQVAGGAVALFSFMVGEDTYLGNVGLSFLARIDRLGRLLFEEPMWPLLVEGEDAAAMRERPISAFWAQELPEACDECRPAGRMWAAWHMSDGVDLASVTFPEQGGGPLAEARGALFADTPAQPRILLPPTIVQDESRFVVVQLEDASGSGQKVTQLWRSQGPGFKFEHMTTDGDLANWAMAPVESTDAYYAVSSADDTMVLLRSKDEGETWTDFLSAPCTGKVVASRLLKGGQWVAVCAPTEQGDTRPFQSTFLGKLMSGVQFKDLGGPPEGLEGPGATLGTSVGIVESDADFALVIPVRGPGVGNGVLVRRFDLSGNLVSEAVSPLEAPFIPSTVVQTSNGTLVGVGAGLSNGDYQYAVVRSTDDFKTQTVRYQDWTGLAGAPLQLQYDKDLNTIYLFDGLRGPGDSVRATVRRSNDHGETWQEVPDLLRPWGGAMQRVNFVVADGDKWLIFLEDNASLRGWQETDDFDDLFQGAAINNVSMPKGELIYMRLAL